MSSHSDRYVSLYAIFGRSDKHYHTNKYGKLPTSVTLDNPGLSSNFGFYPLPQHLQGHAYKAVFFIDFIQTRWTITNRY